MTSRRQVLAWTGSAFCAALCISAATFLSLGAGEKGTDIALRLTARLSFLLFWPAYAGSSLAKVFDPQFGLLKRHGRHFGLAFASAQLVHIGLVGWLCWIGSAPALGTFLFFGIAIVWTYLIALASVGRIQSMLGPRGWWVLRIVGLNYIAYAFAVDFFRGPLLDARGLVLYLPFAILVVAGLILRVIACFAGGRRFPRHDEPKAESRILV